MNTKWYNENHKERQNTDRPIVAAKEEFTGEEDDKPMCPFCWCYTVIKEEFNDRCTRTTCGRIFNIKREDKGVETGIIVESDNMDDNSETLVSTMTPDPNEAFFNKDKIEPKGAFKALQDRGIRITSYEEKDGAGRVIKKNRWS